MTSAVFNPAADWAPHKSGVFLNLPFEVYCDAPGVNHSALKRLDPPETPAHVRAYLDGASPVATEEMLLGTWCHSAILEPDATPPAFAIKPEGMRFSTAEGKAWKAQALAAGQVIVTEERWTALKVFSKNVAADPACRMIFDSGHAEVSIFVPPCKEFPFPRKARVDWVPTDSDALVDVKTCLDASVEGFGKTINDWSYHTQAAWYLDAWNAAGLDRRENFIFIALEKKAPWLVAVYELDAEDIEAGRRRNRDRGRIMGDCLSRNVWPGYPQGILPISRPAWARRKDNP